jgi:Domain of unknown function (DUF4337)
MAEVEIHTGHHHDAPAEPFAHTVGIVVGVIGVLLSVVTILSHREHTAAVVHKTEANDQWAYYQAKKTRQQTAEVGADLVAALTGDASRSAGVAGKFKADASRYASQADDIQKDAQLKDEQSHHAEARAARFDLGEGFLELGLVMTSLYFLATRRFFVVLGAIAAAAGTVIGMIGFFT